MKIQTFLAIIAGCLAFIALVSLFSYSISAQSEKKKAMRFWNYLGRITAYLLLFILMMLRYSTGKEDYYSLYGEQKFSEKHSLPQLDSTMTYVSGSKFKTHYRSWSKDSVLHYSKSIEYDVFDVSSVIDKFYNSKEGLTLESIYIHQNMLRDSAYIYILSKSGDYKNEKSDTITRKDFDRTIKEWGLTDKIYKRFEF